MSKNKFFNELPEFKKEDAEKLREILLILDHTCCRYSTPQGAAVNIERLLKRPSSIRKCDLFEIYPVVQAINRVASQCVDNIKEEKTCQK